MFAFMMPAQQAIIIELVDRDTLLNANSLNAVGMGLMGIGSASLAGVIITVFGVDGVYYVMFLLYVMAIYTLTHLPLTGVTPANGRSVWLDLREGLAYLRHNKILMTLMALGLVRVVFATPYRTLMPSFSDEVMGFGAAGLGLLLAAPGLGGLISSLSVAALGDFSGQRQTLFWSAAPPWASPFSPLLRFPSSPWYWAASLWSVAPTTSA